ncbi:MAG: DEAD/DEAH box helicase, partial [Chitinivibrionales bacterium]|nr:DEAD/DEAH box helicase [Chitinivibrionales bacterium]
MLNFLSSLSEIPGFGPKRIKACKEAGITNVGDLLYHLPYKYLDRTTIIPLAQISQYVNHECTVCGEITRVRLERGRRARLRLQITDEAGDTLEALWFAGVPFLRRLYQTGQRLLMTGTPSVFKTICMVHPTCEVIGGQGEQTFRKFLACYRIPEALRKASVSQNLLRTAIAWLLGQEIHFPRLLPPSLESRNDFPPLAACLEGLHRPTVAGEEERCMGRLVYEEIFQHLLLVRLSRKAYGGRGHALQAGALLPRFLSLLPFTLTNAQEAALSTLLADAASEARMHRLLHGDVGCGKTVVAAAACLPALNNGFCAAWLAPTELLARQTHERLTAWLAPLTIPSVLLTGGRLRQERRAVLDGLQDKKPKVIVGTHALLSTRHNLQRVGMIVIDEQHRFGVKQRLALQQRYPAADVLLMSATPIPQTLAATLYGDLDCVTIDSAPAGRLPVRTHLVPPQKRDDMERFIFEKITTGASQAYYVAPRIEADPQTPGAPADVISVVKRLK